jgi:acyl-CoA:acyl-CoA alkyltransferase
MVAFRYSQVCLEGFGLHLPDTVVSSAELEDRLVPLYQRLEVPRGALERLSGVSERRWWEPSVRPSVVGAQAVEEAIEEANINRDDIGVIINCSVTRDFFEPSTASLIHRTVGLPSSCTAFDLSNACIGFSNGLKLVSSMIESGAIRAAILVSPENPSKVVEATFREVAQQSSTISRSALLEYVPTFTLGCGACAAVVTHESLSKKGHRVIGALAKTESQHNGLCTGTVDFSVCEEREEAPLMHTEAGSLVAAALSLCSRSFPEALQVIEKTPSDISIVFPHQIGRQGSAPAFYRSVGLSEDKEYAIYPTLGNMVSAALPTAMIHGYRSGRVEKGDTSMMVAFGSGLHVVITGVQW